MNIRTRAGVHPHVQGKFIFIGDEKFYAPPGDGPIADCVANAPGGPIHILLSDQEAEHIPGCNLDSWRKTCKR